MGMVRVQGSCKSVQCREEEFRAVSSRPLLLLVLVSILFGVACKRQSKASQSFFPPSDQVAGWAKTGDTRVFEAADLWKYIDGDAERYLKAGVKNVETADYKFRGKSDAVVDIYTMNGPTGATEILQAEPAGDRKGAQLGDEARLHAQSLVFRKGVYLVRIVSYEESPETQPSLLQLGRAIELRLSGR